MTFDQLALSLLCVEIIFFGAWLINAYRRNDPEAWLGLVILILLIMYVGTRL